MDAQPLFNIGFLTARFEAEFRQYLADGTDDTLRQRLTAWATRDVLNEVASEAAFIKLFFQDLWSYALQGEAGTDLYHCHPRFPVPGAGQGGGTGAADLALGLFGGNRPRIPQVLCEFKDITSGLDAPQNRAGNRRSPVQQAWDYLREVRTALTGNELIEPAWAIVTDMNEFRLYRWGKGRSQYERFVLNPTPADRQVSLLDDNDEGCFRRFLFRRLFSAASLLSERGPCELDRMLKAQLVDEANLEKAFYLEYRAYREHVYTTLVAANPQFSGSRSQLVRLTQRLLDRCLFVIFCEDMGVALQFPPDLLRDVLIDYSRDRFYNPDDSMPWERLKSIFRAMRDGGTFGDHAIARFNGGLFAPCPELEALAVPAHLFCARNQGTDTNALLAHPLTLLFFAAKYNFGIKNASHERMIDCYALGRIFEQSITELEIMEAEADGRESINKLSKRKRDGVYYTPEWVTAYIVEETVGARLADLRRNLGLVPENCPDDAEVAKYRRSQADRRLIAQQAVAWLKQNRRLDRWLDFKSFQVFSEATTYTALQFFRGQPTPAVRCAFAPDGVIDSLDWSTPHATIPHDDLPADGAWNLMREVERSLLNRLFSRFLTLGHEANTKQIFQGFKTSGDDLYIGEKRGGNTYLFKMAGGEFDEVELEEDLVNPVISGAESDRYVDPRTDRFIYVLPVIRKESMRFSGVESMEFSPQKVPLYSIFSGS